METPTKSLVDPQMQHDLLKRARRAAERAYAPYSGFPVGAAALTSDGSIFAGCNVENASYGLTICAEQSAISAAAGAGHREILAVAVSAPKVPGTTPCGACRQFLNEFRPQASDMAVVLDDGELGDMVWRDDLLPRAFGPRNLDAKTQDSTSDASTRRDDGR